MIISREEIIHKLADKTGYYQKDVREVLKSYGELILELFGDVTDDEDVTIQLVQGIRIGCTVVPERDRVDPRTQEPIKVKATVKPFARFSDDFKADIQKIT